MSEPTIACPRHGVIDVLRDAPCPVCGVAAYDLADRGARDIVRANRETGLTMKKRLAGVAIFVVVAGAVAVSPLRFTLNLFGLPIPLGALLAAAVAAAFGHRALALKMEREPRLRQLDAELTRRKI